MRVSSVSATSSGLQLADAPTLSDMLAVEREQAMHGRLGIPSLREPSLAELRELHSQLVSAESSEEWELLARAKKAHASPSDVASHEVLLRHRAANVNPMRVKQLGTAAQVLRRAKVEERQQQQQQQQQTQQQAHPEAGPPAPSQRTKGIAGYSADGARALPSGFRQALSRCYSVGGRMSSVSIPSAIGSMDTKGKLDTLRSQSAQLVGEFTMLEPTNYHAASALLSVQAGWAVAEELSQSTEALRRAPSRGACDGQHQAAAPPSAAMIASGPKPSWQRMSRSAVLAQRMKDAEPTSRVPKEPRTAGGAEPRTESRDGLPMRARTAVSSLGRPPQSRAGLEGANRAASSSACGRQSALPSSLFSRCPPPPASDPQWRGGGRGDPWRGGGTPPRLASSTIDLMGEVYQSPCAAESEGVSQLQPSDSPRPVTGGAVPCGGSGTGTGAAMPSAGLSTGSVASLGPAAASESAWCPNESCDQHAQVPSGGGGAVSGRAGLCASASSCGGFSRSASAVQAAPARTGAGHACASTDVPMHHQYARVEMGAAGGAAQPLAHPDDFFSSSRSLPPPTPPSLPGPARGVLASTRPTWGKPQAAKVPPRGRRPAKAESADMPEPGDAMAAEKQWTVSRLGPMAAELMQALPAGRLGTPARGHMAYGRAGSSSSCERAMARTGVASPPRAALCETMMAHSYSTPSLLAPQRGRRLHQPASPSAPSIPTSQATQRERPGTAPMLIMTAAGPVPPPASRGTD